MLAVQNLNKQFGSLHALTDTSFHVNDGEIFGFVGSNGAGKTTTMRIILGVMATDSGSVEFNGVPLNFSMRQHIGYMPEERGLYPRMKIGQQLEYFAALHGLDASSARAATTEWTQRLGIADRRDDEVQKLSLGNQQRVQLAAALVSNPQFLVLDEPFSGLDPVAVDVMSGVLQDAAAAGISTLFSSHQLDLVERLCNRVGIISHGKMVAEGTIDELRQTDTVTYAVAASATFSQLSAAAIQANVVLHPDPLEGSAEAPALQGVTRATFTLERGMDDQAVLRALLNAGSVHEFGPRRPHLTDLFKNVVIDDSPSRHEPSQDGQHAVRGLRRLLGRRAQQ
ncbi:MAG: ATP-binding cassette domain-containing protein [Actinomycetaceae bacterium]|nr:ATP-binding cassette domain-containing protein [Actinomycetaceae bacterium]MDY6083543.1 ATP-binding cassette domain-containing protein [Actinomycetaceae bacterium]